MRLLLSTLILALACTATIAAQSGRVKRAEPQPTPEHPPAEQQGGDRAVTGEEDEQEAREREHDSEGKEVYLAREVTRKARLLSRPAPAYPRRARCSEVQGAVVLRAVLAASGKVEKITVLKGLPGGVTEEAIKAARLIKFVPAERDGRKVSQSVIIEYNFTIY